MSDLDVKPEALTVKQLKSILTARGFEDKIVALNSPRKDDFVKLYKQYVTPTKQNAPFSQVTRTEEKRAGILHMYDSPETNDMQSQRSGPSRPSRKSTIEELGGALPSRLIRQDIVREESPLVTHNNLFQATQSRSRELRRRSGSQAPRVAHARVGARASWLWLVAFLGAVFAIGCVAWYRHTSQACRPNQPWAVPHGQCQEDGQLVCDAGYYVDGTACALDWTYNAKVSRAADWLLALLGRVRGEYECGQRARMGADPFELVDMMAAMFRIPALEGERFLDEVVNAANARHDNAIKRGTGLYVDARLAQRNLTCQITTGARALTWLCLGGFVTGMLIYLRIRRRAHRRLREAELAAKVDEVVQQLRNSAKSGLVVLDFVREEWRGIYSNDIIDEAVERLRNDPRLRIKKMLLHGVERRVIEWLAEVSSTRNDSGPSSDQPESKLEHSVATSQLYPRL